MARRSTREEASKKEDQAVRLVARGLNYAEVGVVLDLSESEARRKHLNGLARRREALAGSDAFIELDAELAELQRIAYMDHDAAEAGSAPRVGFLKLILETVRHRGLLRGIDLRNPQLVVSATAVATSDGATPPDQADSLKAAIREADEDLGRRGREVIELERAAGPDNVRPPEEGTSAGTEEPKHDPA
jgi:hypothetical protein